MEKRNPIQVKKPAEVIRIKHLPFADLAIPPYQRPYKWGVKNVNQLINDLVAFTGAKEYRLGTLVLNGNDIVDGQQRIVTLALLLHELFRQPGIMKENAYQTVRDSVRHFCEFTKFKNPHSIGHVRENLEAIRSRREDLTGSLLSFLLERCEFVVVQLDDIGEAFQYFDSQNARGKDLEPHDLLKAFHLREIDRFSDRDGRNIDDWQAMPTPALVELFLAMFRVKQWSKSNGAQVFTKGDVDAFKGISLHGRDKRFPCNVQQVICECFVNAYRRDPVRQIDGAVLEFPFQLDQTGINGSPFFDMVRHYERFYADIRCAETFRQSSPAGQGKDSAAVTAFDIVGTLNSYNPAQRTRVGDIYARQLFDCMLMYYVDRFGKAEIDKIVRKLFLSAYAVRLEKYSVKLPSIDNAAVAPWSMFRAIRDAKTPYDIINLPTRTLQKEARNSDGDIKKLYNKIIGNG